jgi:hypothetical protein
MGGLLYYTLQSLMPFGKFRGEPIMDVPLDYWTWLYKAMEGSQRWWDRSWRRFIEDNIHYFVTRNEGEVTDDIIFQMERMRLARVMRKKRSKKHRYSTSTDSSIQTLF